MSLEARTSIYIPFDWRFEKKMKYDILKIHLIFNTKVNK